MESAPNKIVVIIGPTASGKSALAIKVAQQFGGEIICADSRTIYKELNIGTAKPSLQDRQTVPHHGLDLVDPSQSFSAADFKDYARDCVADISGRGKLPILVGGSGLYIDGFIYDFEFAGAPDEALRKQLSIKNLLQLQQQAKELGIEEATVSFQNARHLARAIERFEAGQVSPKRHTKPDYVLLLGLDVPREQLVERIVKRVGTMFTNGLIEEAEAAFKKYGPSAPGLSAPGYKALAEYLNGESSLIEAQELFIRKDKQLAKRQMTWFRRNPDIVWCQTEDQALENIRAFLD